MAQKRTNSNRPMIEDKVTKAADRKEPKLQSDIHDSIDYLIQAKSYTVTENSDKIERRQIVHAFTNLRDTMTKEEKNESGREEIINFGSTFRSAQVNIAPLEAIVVGTDSLCEVVVDFNDPNKDHLLGVEISNLANDWFFKNNETFHQFWRTTVGEGYLTGGGPAIFDEQDVGLFPSFNKNFLFPPGSKLDPEKMTYAFERREMTINDLNELIAETEEDDDMVSVGSIKAIIEDIKDTIRGSSASTSNAREGVDLDGNSARSCGGLNKTTFEVWGYWEVRTHSRKHKDKEKRGNKYISHILFTDKAIISAENKSKTEHEVFAILAQEEIAFDDPREWLVMLIFDEEIGGDKKVDTLRGIAEAFYKPAALIEELRNVEVEGAMQAARLTLQEREGADPDEVLDFELGKDLFAPKNIEVLQLPNTGSQVRPVVADLMQTVSGISGSGYSNSGRGQELRQQAVERQDNTQTIKNNNITKAYLKMDNILDLIIGRGLNLDPPSGTSEYRLIKGFQEAVDDRIIQIFKLLDQEDDGLGDAPTAKVNAKKIRLKLGERGWGKFKNIRVKTRRTATGLDRPTEVENANFILRMVETGRVPAENVPALMQRAVAYQTQNTDIAELASAVPELIKSDQMERAAAEWETIKRRATAGEIYPIGPRDIDEDHIESHIMDTIADVNANGLRPWDQLNVTQLVAGVNHTGAHIQRMQQRPESAGVAKMKMMELQEVVAQAGAIIQLLEEQKAQQDKQEMSPDDRLAIAREQKIYTEIEILGRKFGVDIEDKKDIMRNRMTRAQQNQERLNLMNRNQVVNEVNSDRQFQLSKQQTGIQAASLMKQNGQTN
jgi:hypothetical protein